MEWEVYRSQKVEWWATEHHFLDSNHLPYSSVYINCSYLYSVHTTRSLSTVCQAWQFVGDSFMLKLLTSVRCWERNLTVYRCVFVMNHWAPKDRFKFMVTQIGRPGSFWWDKTKWIDMNTRDICMEVRQIGRGGRVVGDENGQYAKCSYVKL